MDVIVISQCQKELDGFPKEILGEVLDAVAKLRIGITLSMPLSRPMPSLGRGVHELRLSDRSGQYRIIYVLIKGAAIYMVHAFHKKTQETSLKNIDTILRRIKKL